MSCSALGRAGRLLAVLAVLAFGALLGAGPAAAHSVLLSTSPPRGGTVDTAPSSVSLTFDEMPQGQFSTIHVTGPDGQRRDNGHVQVLNDVVTEPLAGTRPAGRYVVDWRVVSADGHPVSGEFTFTARSAAQQLVSAPRPSTVPAGPVSPSSNRHRRRRRAIVAAVRRRSPGWSAYLVPPTVADRRSAVHE